MANEEDVPQIEFITPPNNLKRKVGSGGLSEEILEKAQGVLEEKSEEFQPLAELYLDQCASALRKFESDKIDGETLLADINYYCVQLRAGAGMFNYTLVHDMCGLLIEFAYELEEVDNNALDVIAAFYAAIKAISSGKVRGDAGERGKDLLLALEKACSEYRKRNL